MKNEKLTDLKVLLIVGWGAAVVFASLRVSFLKETAFMVFAGDVYHLLFPDHRVLRVDRDIGNFNEEKGKGTTQCPRAINGFCCFQIGASLCLHAGHYNRCVHCMLASFNRYLLLCW